MKHLFIIFLWMGGSMGYAQTLPTIEEKTKTMTAYEGFFTMYYEEPRNALWLEVPNEEQEFLFQVALRTGVGSNDIGLDRGQLGKTRVVYFEKRGNRFLMIEPNLEYRSSSSSTSEQNAIKESFAQSVLWAFDIGAAEGNTYLIDVTPFLMYDWHGVAKRLKYRGQGTYNSDSKRSYVMQENLLNFVNNSEMESMLTFTGKQPGAWVYSVTPTAEVVSVIQHLSFIKLPDNNYTPRPYDPRTGNLSIGFYDYSVPIAENLEQRYVVRHRLEKENPDMATSKAKEPIVYYLDPGTPEPVKSALLDGAKWWAAAFEALGYEDAYRVEVLPEDAHPLDVRYNVIQWVHRSTRGWSYGASVVDPRTGEIIKGHVSLGSLRVRQDYLIAEGLLAPYKNGTMPADDPMLKMALARLRQLSAHEVGHTLGLAHNFAASVNDRASVMDYPHPLVRLVNGKLNLDEAYGVGIGAWDKVAIAYAYSDFGSDTPEKEGLKRIIETIYEDGLLYITDRDARPQGGSHPDAHLWDNGKDPIKALDEVLKVRKYALDRFSENNIPMGEPIASLQRTLTPIYLYHRYQTEAVVKLIGGYNYAYKMRGDGQHNAEMLSPKKQWHAVEALLKTVNVDNLMLPESILNVLYPLAPGMSRSREDFMTHSSPNIGALDMVETAANMTFKLLLNGERASRLLEFHIRNKKQPGLQKIIEKLITETWYRTHRNNKLNDVQQSINIALLNQLMALAQDKQTPTRVRAVVHNELKKLKHRLQNRIVANKERPSYARSVKEYAIKQIKDAWEKKEDPIYSIPNTPPGSPIGWYKHSDSFSNLLCTFDH